MNAKTTAPTPAEENKTTEETTPKTKHRSPAYVAAKIHTELARCEGAVAKAKAELQTKTEALEAARAELKSQPPEVAVMVLAMGGRK